MVLKEKLNLIEDALELDLDSITEDSILDDLDGYDSMGKLSIIVLADDEFNKKLTGELLREFRTVRDLLNFFED